MKEEAIEKKLREALAAEPSAAADAAVLRAIEKAAERNAAAKKAAARSRAAWFRFRGPAAGLLAASLAAIAFVHTSTDPSTQNPQAAAEEKPATSTAAANLAAAVSGQDASQFTMDEADIMLELTSMSQDCLIL